MTSVVAVERRRAVAELRADRRPGRAARSSPGAPRRRRATRSRRVPQATSSTRVAARIASASRLELLEPDLAVAGHPAGDATGGAPRAARGSP